MLTACDYSTLTAFWGHTTDKLTGHLHLHKMLQTFWVVYHWNGQWQWLGKIEQVQLQVFNKTHIKVFFLLMILNSRFIEDSLNEYCNVEIKLHHVTEKYMLFQLSRIYMGSVAYQVHE